MARRTYFSGNYGSALGSTANAANLIARAGEAQGQMYANLGQQIGGMIEQYGLNKEKQKENKATIKSSIGILQRMSKLDKANAPEYMASIQQLENEDIPLSQRGMLADKTLQGLSITNQLQGQMLSNQEKQQALGLARQLEASTVENAKLQNTNLGLRNDLTELTKRKGEAITEAEIRSILSKYDAEQETLPSETAAKIGANELTAETAQASRKLLPLQTADKEGEFAARSTQRKIDDEVINQSGGIQGAASKRVKDSNLASADTQSRIDYRNNLGLAQLYKSLAEKNPTFAEQFNPLASLQDKLRAVTVKTPKGESVTYAEYEKLHNEDPELYPMNNEPGAIRGQIELVNSQIYNLSREQTVQVNVPDNLSQDGMVTPTENNITNNIDTQTAQLMAGPGALTQAQRTITDPAAIAVLKRGGTFRGKTLQQLIDEGVIIQGL
jgi:hypothetical protein